MRKAATQAPEVPACGAAFAVGGGLRGIYGAGVLDRCMEEGVQFDCYIGVSAGSANMCSYVAGQHGRNKPFYQDYSFRKEYMSVGNLVHKHSYLDLEYVYGALRMEQAVRATDMAASFSFLFVMIDGSFQMVSSLLRITTVP